jgi:hypothetical protein
MLFPWPHRDERTAAVHAAAAEKDRSCRDAAVAAKLERQIAAMAEENHFAEVLASQIIARHKGAR